MRKGSASKGFLIVVFMGLLLLTGSNGIALFQFSGQAIHYVPETLDRFSNLLPGLSKKIKALVDSGNAPQAAKFQVYFLFQLALLLITSSIASFVPQQ